MSLIAIVTSDIFLAAKVQALVGQGGFAARRVAPTGLGALDPPPALVVLDLGLPADVREEAARTALGMAPVVAFGAHVDRQALAWARAAGLQAVLTKGQLASRLAGEVAKALGVGDP
jgi:AmiR/NasT family two-component response regulator